MKTKTMKAAAAMKEETAMKTKKAAAAAKEMKAMTASKAKDRLEDSAMWIDTMA